MSDWRSVLARVWSDDEADDFDTSPSANLPKLPKPPAERPDEGTVESFGNFGKTAEAPAFDPERAAIIEFEAKVPREWAEGFARLLARPCPPMMSARDWRAVLEGAGRFLDAWAVKAHALGWSAEELFGLDPSSNLNRLDRRGAAFLLAHSEVVAITAEDIALRRDGSVQRIRKRGVSSPVFGGTG